MLTFQKEATFFHTSTSMVIINYLTTHFWGDDLLNKANLLIKLLYYDAGVTRQYAETLRAKSDELNRYFNQL